MFAMVSIQMQWSICNQHNGLLQMYSLNSLVIVIDI